MASVIIMCGGLGICTKKYDPVIGLGLHQTKIEKCLTKFLKSESHLYVFDN